MQHLAENCNEKKVWDCVDMQTDCLCWAKVDSGLFPSKTHLTAIVQTIKKYIFKYYLRALTVANAGKKSDQYWDITSAYHSAVCYKKNSADDWEVLICVLIKACTYAKHDLTRLNRSRIRTWRIIELEYTSGTGHSMRWRNVGVGTWFFFFLLIRIEWCDYNCINDTVWVCQYVQERLFCWVLHDSLLMKTVKDR